MNAIPGFLLECLWMAEVSKLYGHPYHREQRELEFWQYVSNTGWSRE